MAISSLYISIFIILSFAGFGACHPGFGLGIMLGVGGTALFGGVIATAITVGIVVTTIYRDRYQVVAEPIPQHAPLIRSPTPENEHATNEEIEDDRGRNTDGNTEAMLESLHSGPEVSSHHLRPENGSLLLLGLLSSSPSSAKGSSISSKRFEEECSSCTSLDDVQTVVLDKEQREEEHRGSRDGTPISRSDHMLSHLGQAPGLEADMPEVLSSITTLISHRYILSRTRSGEIDFPPGIDSQAGVEASSSPSSRAASEAAHDSDYSTESMVGTVDHIWSPSASETSSLNGELETRLRAFHRIQLDLDGNALPQAIARAQTVSPVLPPSESLRRRATNNFRMIEAVEAVMMQQRLQREGAPVQNSQRNAPVLDP